MLRLQSLCKTSQCPTKENMQIMRGSQLEDVTDRKELPDLTRHVSHLIDSSCVFGVNNERNSIKVKLELEDA